MTRNLQLTHGLTQTEAVMMALAPYLWRQRAHDLIYAAARAAITDQRPVLDVLAEAPPSASTSIAPLSASCSTRATTSGSPRAWSTGC